MYDRIRMNEAAYDWNHLKLERGVKYTILIVHQLEVYLMIVKRVKFFKPRISNSFKIALCKVGVDILIACVHVKEIILLSSC